MYLEQVKLKNMALQLVSRTSEGKIINNTRNGVNHTKTYVQIQFNIIYCREVFLLVAETSEIIL